MKTVTQEQARELAVRYNAFCEAINRPPSTAREMGVQVWGQMLEDTQRATGIVLVKNVEKIIDYAYRRSEGSR